MNRLLSLASMLSLTACASTPHVAPVGGGPAPAWEGSPGAHPTPVPELEGAHVLSTAGGSLCGAIENVVRCVGVSQTVALSGVVEDFFASPYGGFEGCARLRTGAVECWSTPSGAPKILPIAGVTDAAEIARDERNVCVTRTNGILSCFYATPDGYVPSPEYKYLDAKGKPTQGKLVGTCLVKGPAKEALCSAIDFASFARARGGWVDWIAGYAGEPGNPPDKFVIGRDQNGRLHGVGNNFYGQLGNGEHGHDDTSSDLTALGPVTSYAVGNAHVCAVIGGKVACWGASSRGQVPTRAAVRPQTCDIDDSNLEEKLAKAREEENESIRACEAQPRALDCRLGRRPLTLDDMKRPKFDGKCLLAKEPVMLELEPSPVFVPGIDDAVQVVALQRASCARRKTGQVVCWGEGFEPKK